jgi:hypothetical protein
MTIFFIAVLILDGVLLLASRAKERQDWAAVVCDNAMNLCDRPSWLAIGGVIVVGMLLVTRIGR